MKEFLDALADSSPVPGGGGASALAGALAAALCSMVGNLTTGKKKYAAYEEDIQRILKEAVAAAEDLYELIAADAKAFAPLAEAYGIPKDDPTREGIMEEALQAASAVPMRIAERAFSLLPLLEELEEKGSRLALSDVAVAASLCGSALESAVMNVYINTRLMKDRECAAEMNEKALQLVEEGKKRCEAVYNRISLSLRN